MMAQASTSGLILREAYAQGVLGADSGYAWFFTDAVTDNMGGVIDYLTLDNPCSECGDDPPAALSESEAAAALTGAVSAQGQCASP